MFDLFESPPQRKTPRRHQLALVEAITSSMRRGHRRVAAQLPTGGGKTFIASMIVERALAKGNRAVFTVPAIALVDQTVAAFEAEGIDGIGVMQGDHPRTDPDAPVQIASVQTLARRGVPDAGIVLVDECHIFSKAVIDWMAQDDAPYFVGLSATPWRRGMAAEWQDLVIAGTTGELIEGGYLSPFRVFAAAHPDLTGIKTVAGDYKSDDLAERMSDGAMVADVVTTWLARGEARPTLCFAVNRAHAKALQEDFDRAGVPTGYIDAFTDTVERRVVLDRFARGEIKVICNVGCLTTGFDGDVRCIILARPTKSEMLYVQMIGRGLRTAEGKADCLILDHSDNTARLGFVTDIHHAELLPGTVNREPVERTEPLPKECPKCHFMKPAKVHECPSCGFKPERQPGVEMMDGELAEVGGPAKKREATRDEKQEFWSGLLQIAVERGRKQGWAAHAYKEKFGKWPRGLRDVPSPRPTDEVRNWVRAKDIRYAKRREKAQRQEAAA